MLEWAEIDWARLLSFSDGVLKQEIPKSMMQVFFYIHPKKTWVKIKKNYTALKRKLILK